MWRPGLILLRPRQLIYSFISSCLLMQSRGPADEEDGEGEGANYQLDMMRCLREVNVDNNTVGW